MFFYLKFHFRYFMNSRPNCNSGAIEKKFRHMGWALRCVYVGSITKSVPGMILHSIVVWVTSSRHLFLSRYSSTCTRLTRGSNSTNPLRSRNILGYLLIIDNAQPLFPNTSCNHKIVSSVFFFKNTQKFVIEKHCSTNVSMLLLEMGTRCLVTG